MQIIKSLILSGVAALLALPIQAQTIMPQTASMDNLKSVHPWYGARVAYFGDSVTDPRNSGSKEKYWGYLQDFLDITPLVYGVSGRTWGDIPRQARQLQADHGNDFDAILIFVGTNDYNQGAKLGQWYEEGDTMVYYARGKQKALVERKFRRMSYDASTYRGRINTALKTLKEMFTDKQIVLLTPLHRAYFEGNDTNVQPDERMQNVSGEYIDPYIESVKEAGNIWGVPVIDFNAVSGLYPLINGTTYFHNEKDLLHPNDVGHKRMAMTLVYQLLNLPCKF